MLPDDESVSRIGSSPHLRMKMLRQMAEALEDEAAGLYQRAAGFEEEEFILTCEMNERQTEINRLMLKRDSLRSERDRLLEKIASLRSEAEAMRDEVLNSEEEIALAAITGSQTGDELMRGDFMSLSLEPGETEESDGALYFRRARLGEEAR